MTDFVTSQVFRHPETSEAAHFMNEVSGMTNEQITVFIADKPATYVDNTLLDHSGEFFDPVQFYFPDGSILSIFDWSEEMPVMRVYEQRLTGSQLIDAYQQETGDFEFFCSQLLASLNAHVLSGCSGHTLAATQISLLDSDLILLLSAGTFEYTIRIPDSQEAFTIHQLIGDIKAAYHSASTTASATLNGQ